jgi:serine/threonine protein kinase
MYYNMILQVKINLELNRMNCIQIYGMTYDPQSKVYAIVTEFKEDGSLRKVIKNNHSSLTWNTIIQILRDISSGLYAIHNKNYHHKDFHSGNILNAVKGKSVFSVITDFGLCCPADQSPADKTLYGVLPFVAPEVLRGEEFTKAADIYGFGMIMSEMISGEAPFIDRDYDLHLALNICKGERPQIPEYAPEPYVTLMKRCWDPIPANRPTAVELGNQLLNWYFIVFDVFPNGSYYKDHLLAIKQDIEEHLARNEKIDGEQN